MGQQAKVLLVEDEPVLREALRDTLNTAGYTVAAVSGGEEALALVSDGDVSMVITDVQMKPMNGYQLLERIRALTPEIPVLMMTAYGSVEKAVECLHGGAVDYLVKPFEADTLVEIVARHALTTVEGNGEFVTEDKATRAILALAKRVASTEATVMITGESGVGKEVLARYVHTHSPRAQAPFVAINCAAIPDNMLEATLFGFEKGAFTGAYQASPGKFEQAQGGTLLLDEISEMNLGLQAKLLRVLQEREVERLGGRRTIPLDVRVLATSNRNLRVEVAAGNFREDLFYRLNVFPLRLPPLRERLDDVLPVARRMLARGARAHGRPVPELSEDACGKLLTHLWPGNVRELENVIQRALILQTGGTIFAGDLAIEEAHPVVSATTNATTPDDPPTPGAEATDGLDAGHLKSYEYNVILETLNKVAGNRKQAADRLGISQRTLRYKLARMRTLGIPVP